MSRVKEFVKKEMTLCIAFVAVVISVFFVPPDRAYLGYIDWRTLALLYCLMVVVGGMRVAGIFSALAHYLCQRATSVRTIGAVLVALCFVSSMFLTNDVALLTFVPFSVVVLGMTGEMKVLSWVVVLQTVAANLGSMLTPVGNPQNLYLYSHYGMGIGEFLGTTLPLWGFCAVTLAALCLLLPKEPISVFLGEEPDVDKKTLWVYLMLFGLCMLVVFRLLNWPAMLGAIVLILLYYERRALLRADFFLLLTFVCFFVFSGNLARMDTVADLLHRLIIGREMLMGAVVSQVISNVPAALLLSGFTENAEGLLLGVNIGGLGTPIASLASLISLKLYAQSGSGSTGNYLGKFLLVNIALLALLLGFSYLVLV